MKSTKKTYFWLPLIPILFLCTIYPMITRLFLYDSGYEAYDWFDKTTQASDLFLAWKTFALELTGVILAVVLITFLVRSKKRKKLNIMLWLMIGYAVLTLISTLCSQYNTYSWFGAYEQFEPVWCTIIYVLIALYIYYLTDRPEQLRILLTALAIGTFVLGLIGMLQFLGLDPVTSSIGKFFIMPADLRGSTLDGEGFRGLSYLTLYNPNYVGTYVSLLLPLFFSMAVSEPDRRLKLLSIADCILLVISGLGCQSDSARWGITVVSILLGIVWFCKMKDLRSRLLLAGSCILMILAVNVYYSCRIDVTYTETATADQTEDQTDSAEGEELIPISENLRSIETLDDHLHVEYRESGFDIAYSVIDGQFNCSLTDTDGAEIASERVGEQYLFQITDSRFDGIQFAPVSYEDGSYGLQLIIDGKKWNFTNEWNGETGYYYYNEFGKFDRITTAENYLFKNHGSFGNGRGFIWGETLALLKHTLILGTGADSFAIVFPQDNYVEKYLNGYETMIISKPHNMFLQLGVQNGVLALLLFLAAIMICVWRLWKTRNTNAGPAFYGWTIGILIGIIGYLFTGIVNDVTVCVAPVFWCLVGIGVVLSDHA